MPWRKASFKDGTVWAQVGADGAPALDGGRQPIRYSKSAGAKVYLATAANVAIDPASASEELPFGVDAEEKPAKGAAKSGKAKGSGFGKAGTRTAAQADAARADATRRIGALPAGTIACYTDGACHGNPGPAGSGVVVVLPDGRRAEASKALGRSTNNVAELTAIEMALELLDQAEVGYGVAAVVFTDSSYARGVLVQGWKAKANTELILSIRGKLRARPAVRIEWVAGHAGVAGNERADVLAGNGVRGLTTSTWIPAPEAS
jgi:ribonuclease HI